MTAVAYVTNALCRTAERCRKTTRNSLSQFFLNFFGFAHPYFVILQFTHPRCANIILSAYNNFTLIYQSISKKRSSPFAKTAIGTGT